MDCYVYFPLNEPSISICTANHYTGKCHHQWIIEKEHWSEAEEEEEEEEEGEK